MMSGYDVEITALRRAADAARNAADQVRGVDLAGAISGIAGALPGSGSASAAPRLGHAWVGQVERSSRGAGDLGLHMGAAADRYEANDDAAVRDLTKVFQSWMYPA